ncbi:DUF4365 domain-containing protein [Halococcus sp. IIIV-5B]|uniref:DUF4365 domain-containing protein n=1 Tax=Halococcus sp. IIIV-5B TaxID=2321230 RepID=UPI001314240E|nr:DUF4365 domain-containing protein [Halococcus sp. IIIV-5B]
MTNHEREPRGHSPTDEAERASTSLLEYHMVGSGLKPEIERNDKSPSEDGFIHVSEGGSPLGRVVVQVKTIHDAKQGSPKHQTDVRTLFYKYIREEPFILIGVDTDANSAYWQHITKEYIRSLDIRLDQESKVVHFPEENEMIGNMARTATEFRKIIKKNRAKYPVKRIGETHRAVKSLIDLGQHDRAVGVIRSEIDDATKNVLRIHEIDFPHFYKLRGLLKFHGLADGRRGKVYRSITDLDHDHPRDVNLDVVKWAEKHGISLLSHLYNQQFRRDI